MANFSFYCRSSKMNRYGYAPIELSIIIDGKRCFINLPRKEKPSVFKTAMASKKHNDVKEYINVQISAINSAITAIIASGHPLTAVALRDYIQNGGIKLYTLENLFEDFIKILDVKCEYENLMKYIKVKDDFITYIGDKDKPLTQITNSDIQGFYAQLCKVHKGSTAAAKIAKLKCFFRYALDNNKISVNVFSNVRVTKPKPTIEYLTESEVNTLINKDFGIERLNRVKDLFVFQCGSGLAYADMSNLSPSDIQVDGSTTYIKKTRQKTDIEYTAVLLPFAIDILKKYNYQLPVLSNQKLNAYLQEVGDLCGITKRLHTHLARKTYATYLLNKGVSISVVAKALGHANSRITESTYAAIRTDTVINSISKVIMGDN